MMQDYARTMASKALEGVGSPIEHGGFKGNGTMQDWYGIGNLTAGVGKNTSYGPYAFADFYVPFMDGYNYTDNQYNTPFGELELEKNAEYPGVMTTFYPNEKTMHYLRAIANALGADNNLRDRGYPDSSFTQGRGISGLALERLNNR